MDALLRDLRRDNGGEGGRRRDAEGRRRFVASAPGAADAVRTAFRCLSRVDAVRDRADADPRGILASQMNDTKDTGKTHARDELSDGGVETVETVERRSRRSRDERYAIRHATPSDGASETVETARRVAEASRWRRKPTPPRFARRSRAKPTRTPSPPALERLGAPRPRVREADLLT